VLSSLCVDLRISEVVDAGQYIVSALLPPDGFRLTQRLKPASTV
jgi:acetamidase/formamidase